MIEYTNSDIQATAIDVDLNRRVGSGDGISGNWSKIVNIVDKASNLIRKILELNENFHIYLIAGVLQVDLAAGARNGESGIAISSYH